MTGFPVFKAAQADAQGSPIQFGVEGEPTPFSIARPVPAIPLLDMAVEAMDGPSGDDRQALAAFHRFLQGVLADDWPRFRKASTRARLGVDEVLAIVRYVVTEATGRPTTPPSASPPGAPATGAPLTGAPSQMAAPTPLA